MQGEKDLEKRMLTLELDLMKVRLDEAKRRGDMVMEFTKGLVRNTEFRRNVYTSNNIPGHNSGGGWVDGRTETLSTDTTDTTE